MNVFEKCLRRQMGNEPYNGYMEVCRKNFAQKNLSQFTRDSRPIFDAMYEQLQGENEAGIAERLRDMVDTLKVAFRITRQFIFVVLTYVMANLVIIMLGLDYYVTCASILLMGICFLYKLVEFLSNKYCVMDAYLFMIYKSVLEKLAKELP